MDTPLNLPTPTPVPSLPEGCATAHVETDRGPKFDRDRGRHVGSVAQWPKNKRGAVPAANAASTEQTPVGRTCGQGRPVGCAAVGSGEQEEEAGSPFAIAGGAANAAVKKKTTAVKLHV